MYTQTRQSSYPSAATVPVAGVAVIDGGGGVLVSAESRGEDAPLPPAPAQSAHDPLAMIKTITEGLAPVEKPPEIDQPGTLLADLTDPLPEKDNPAALFKNGFIRKGMGWVLVALAGIGKSAWTIQGSILWAMGKSFFGITPIRPLNIAIIQSEDDKEEVAHFRNEITKGLLADTYDKQRIAEAMTKVRVFEFMGLVGEAFCDKLRTLLACYPDLDLVIINPYRRILDAMFQTTQM